MSTLHMDVETARGVQRGMLTSQDQLSSLLKALNTQADTLRQAWMGGSAAQFDDAYTQWQFRLLDQLEALSDLAARLDAEINQWEETGRALE